MNDFQMREENVKYSIRKVVKKTFSKMLEQDLEPITYNVKNTKVTDEYLKDNYRKYLDESLMVGFMSNFPETKEECIDSIVIEEDLLNHKVTFNVRFTQLTYGDDNEYEVLGIVTDELSISNKLPMNGFNSFSHQDIGLLLDKAVVIMAAKHDLVLCKKVCSWPFGKAIVTKKTDSHKLT